MPTPETLSAREVAARKLRERLPRVFSAGDLGMSGPADPDAVVTIVLEALLEVGEAIPAWRALADVTAERDSFKADLDVTRGMLTAARRHADEAQAELKERSLMAERLATRLAEHAGCCDHTEAAPGRGCPFCEDRSAYLAFVAAGGRDYRDGSASQGEPVSIFEVRRHAIQQDGDGS